MEIAGIDENRKRHFAFFCFGLFLPIIGVFAVIDIIEKDTLEAILDIVAASVLLCGLWMLRKNEMDPMRYRVMLGVFTLVFLINVAIGAGRGTVIFWLTPFPLIFMFFLGKKEGGVASVIFLGALSVLLFNPFSLPLYPYSTGIGLRFLAALFLVGLTAYGIESSRGKYERLLIVKHGTLLEEKEHLQRALKEIKTLSGLIPICANCKKVRDDTGYWQKVEEYVRNRTSAEFTHGICPECAKELYPEFTIGWGDGGKPPRRNGDAAGGDAGGPQGAAGDELTFPGRRGAGTSEKARAADIDKTTVKAV